MKKEMIQFYIKLLIFQIIFYEQQYNRRFNFIYIKKSCKMKKFEDAIEAIGQGLYELDMNEEESKDVNTLLSLTREAYILVQWPESQEFMEKEWFDEEAIFCGGSEDKTGSAAYFIPLKYMIE